MESRVTVRSVLAPELGVVSYFGLPALQLDEGFLVRVDRCCGHFTGLVTATCRFWGEIMSVAHRTNGLVTRQTLVCHLHRVVRVPPRRRISASRHRLNMQPVRASQATTTLTLKPLDASYEDTHSFASFSNWIIPEHLMVGRYPYVEPGELKKCATHAVGEEQLKKILETGIRTFVSLQVDFLISKGGV